MTYMILAAGKGNNLQPLTLKYAKTSYKLDEDTTVLQRMVRCIRKADKNAEIVVVVGYKAEEIKRELDGENVHFVMNSLQKGKHRRGFCPPNHRYRL